MVAVHTELAFEEAIEAQLLAHGYLQGNRPDYEIERALDRAQVLAFVQDSQPQEWARLTTTHGDVVEEKFLARLAKEMDSRGTLDVLRHGITDYGVSFKLAYFRPAHGLAPELQALYAKNRLSITRQLRYSLKHANELDLVLFVNGLPVATAELKNALTGQTVQHAIAQYRKDRDPKDALLGFNRRALVHFAVDTDQVYMTTRLAGEETVFLPFNRGRDTGAGNPDNPRGYRTAYLWEEVWQRDSLLDILARFMHLERTDRVEDGKTIQRESMIFPRYHQLDAVRRLEAHARMHGSGQNYLIQHSAGSGKSNSIAWLAHRLANLHDANDHAIFSSVIVITDRRVLDRQLQDTIYQFEHAQGVVERIDKDSAQLAKALETGKRIIITTLQKFPYVLEKLTADRRLDKRYALIIDEAHSSQTGDAAQSLREALAPYRTANQADPSQPRSSSAPADQQDADGDDTDDAVNRVIEARGRQPHLSYFAFTATPKFKTLTIFGTPGPDGKPQPFHLYSMRQAIEEGFILDVLKNYVTYKTYFRLEKAGQNDPQVQAGMAGKAIAQYVSLHPHNIAQKIAVIVEHFRRHCRRKIGGRAKAMVVTRSRLHAVRYKRAFDAYLAEKRYTDVKALVAFSGTVTDPDNALEYTERGMNGFGEGQLPEKFKSDDYQVLLVAEKYQTGFDEPLLHSMYVDKRLDGVKAVQTLSRLNRTCPGKDDTFVLDFVNDAEDIRIAFEPYYKVAAIDEPTDPNQLYDLKSKLDGSQVYWQAEVDAFCRAFFVPASAQSKMGHAALNAAIDPAVARYIALPGEEQELFRSQMVSFSRLYAFLSQVLPFQDAALERLYAYGRFLLLKLPHRDSALVDLGVDVRLDFYRLSLTGQMSLGLGLDDVMLGGPSEVGTAGPEPPMVPLSSIIAALNERFGTDFTLIDQLVFDQIEEELVANADLARQAQVNRIDNYKYGFDQAFLTALIGRKSQNEQIFARMLNEPAFAEAVKAQMIGTVYRRQNEPSAANA